MFEDVVGLSIEGKCFIPKTDLKFFPNKSDRVSVIYGRNGSGKSTIAAGFELIADNIETEELRASLLKSKEDYINYDSINNLYVFDENYIEKNIRIDDAGLGTIVLFGEQIDLNNEIESIRKLKNEALSKLNILLDNLIKYHDSKNLLSPDYYCKRIIEILSSDWADRVRIIKGYKKNASVTYDAINEICALENTKDLDELEKEYKETFDLFSKISDSSITYPNKIEQFEIDENCERKIIELLEKSINEPTLTEREKAILSIVNSGQQARVEESINIFKDPSTSYCPYCYQNVSESYKKELIESISKIINKDVDTHKNELTKLIMKPIEFQTNLFQQLNSDLVDKMELV